MNSLSVSDITRLLQIAGLAIAILAVLLVVFRLSVWIMRHVLRKKMSSGNTDLIGQLATVRRTVRSQRPGEIECEFRGQLLSGSAISTTKIRPGKQVLIYASENDCYKVRPLEYDYIEGKYEADRRSEPR